MIFTIKNNVPQINPESLFIPELKAIWDSDKDKSFAQKKLCYVYHMADPKSVYQRLPEEERESTIIADFIGDKKWKPSKLEEAAIEKYRKLNETVALRYLKATEYAMDSVAKILRTTAVDVDNMKDIISAVEKGEKLISSYSKLLEQVEKEVSSNRKIRGGVRPSIFDSE
jgi:flagellar biosynthesis component FlhA